MALKYFISSQNFRTRFLPHATDNLLVSTAIIDYAHSSPQSDHSTTKCHHLAPPCVCVCVCVCAALYERRTDSKCPVSTQFITSKDECLVAAMSIGLIDIIFKEGTGLKASPLGCFIHVKGVLQTVIFNAKGNANFPTDSKLVSLCRIANYPGPAGESRPGPVHKMSAGKYQYNFH